MRSNPSNHRGRGANYVPTRHVPVLNAGTRCESAQASLRVHVVLAVVVKETCSPACDGPNVQNFQELDRGKLLVRLRMYVCVCAGCRPPAESQLVPCPMRCTGTECARAWHTHAHTYRQLHAVSCANPEAANRGLVTLVPSKAERHGRSTWCT